MLAELYPKLCKKIPADKAALFGLPVGVDAPFWLTIDANAFPAILLPASKDDLRPDIELRAVEALFSRACTISLDDRQTHVGCFSLIRLKDNDPDVVRLFLKIVEERFCIPNLQYDNAAILRAPDTATEFGAARVWSETVVADIRLGEAPSLRVPRRIE